MRTGGTSRLVVENIHKLSRRPWIFVTGRLEGDPLRIGDSVTVRGDGDVAVPAVVRSIELHGAPGRTTIALDATLGTEVTAGTVIARP
ncbi:hypothetical protein [Actinoplanes sp. N902-109]|uniref:hypothetical protein n=1 Tax=Actinoplanes sp. (strain N902-109) TaxID=649831 RepID=UPI0003295560|nr:hypothetical protein [Actinoplanes sp. N902-109]AGL18680.1 hypothetical protein L083_5170 [Actinoplanes sp. N902-109]